MGDFFRLLIVYMEIVFGFGPYLKNTDVQNLQPVKKQEPKVLPNLEQLHTRKLSSDLILHIVK